MSKTEIIRFEDGEGEEDFWEIKTYLSVAAEREWVQHAMDSQATFQDQSPELIASLARRMDKLVIGQTVSWSYGSVDLDTFYEIPSHHYYRVAERMGDIYSPLVVKSIEKALKLYTSLSNQEETSQ